jgi:hypothetical protein
LLPTVAGFVMALLVLAWLSRQLSLHIQKILAIFTRSLDLAIVLFFLILFPGVVIHEAAHWVTARLVGLKPSKFRVWPKKQGKFIGLGSVTVQRGNLWQETFVGMAPLFVGTILLALIGEHIFHIFAVSAALSGRQWAAGEQAFAQILQTPDGVLWGYLLFAIANAMMPSASDREPVKPLLLYSALALVGYLLLGLPLAPFSAVLSWLAPMLQTVTNALIFIIVLDALLLGGLFLVVKLIDPDS